MPIRKSTVALAIAGCLSILGVSPVPAQLITVSPGMAHKLQQGLHKPRILPQIDTSRLRNATACPDPAVDMRIMRVVAHQSASGPYYKFVLRSLIRNVGRAQWVSRLNQQYASLTLQPPGGRPHVYFRRAFTRLPPGGVIAQDQSLIFHMDNEFPPDATLRIVYDPDIRADGNPLNDDCRASNNVRHLSGQEIMRMLRATAH